MTGISHQFPFAVAIVLLYIILGHWLERYRKRGRGGHCCAHESGPAVILGAIVGGILKAGWGETAPFSADVFFFFVLPPVIFAQGYTLHGSTFFANFHYIFAFGIVGTLMQFVLLTAFISALSGSISELGGTTIHLETVECLLLAAVLSPSDEVAVLSLIKPDDYPKLGAILFGEGVLNDALSIVLFRAVFNLSLEGDGGASELNDGPGAVTRRLTSEALWLLVVAVVLGLAVGLLVSRLFKVTPSLRAHPTRQCALVLLGGYLAYGASEALEMSGITALFFASISMARYAWHSLSGTAQVATVVQFESMATMAEAFAFTYARSLATTSTFSSSTLLTHSSSTCLQTRYLGLSVFALTASKVSLGFTLAMLLAVLVTRALAISAIVMVGRLLSPGSWRHGDYSIGWPEASVVSTGGMVRGAIAWAQVLQIQTKNREVLVTTTMFIVLVTTIAGGGGIPLLLQKLHARGHLEGGGGAGGDGGDAHGARPMSPTGAGSSEGGGGLLHQRITRWFVDFDKRRMQPVFGGAAKAAAGREMQSKAGGNDLGTALLSSAQQQTPSAVDQQPGAVPEASLDASTMYGRGFAAYAAAAAANKQSVEESGLDYAEMMNEI
jgi:NhaP-type Na+/H+ or K+/H+ antiporter